MATVRGSQTLLALSRGTPGPCMSAPPMRIASDNSRDSGGHSVAVHFLAACAASTKAPQCKPPFNISQASGTFGCLCAASKWSAALEEQPHIAATTGSYDRQEVQHYSTSSSQHRARIHCQLTSNIHAAQCPAAEERSQCIKLACPSSSRLWHPPSPCLCPSSSVRLAPPGQICLLQSSPQAPGSSRAVPTHLRASDDGPRTHGHLTHQRCFWCAPHSCS